MSEASPINRNPSFICRPGLVCDVEGDWRPYEAETVPGRPGIYRIGKHLYDDHFKPLTEGAPAITDAWDFRSSMKYYTKGRREKEAQIIRRVEEGLKAEALAKRLAGPDGWKEKPLSDLPRNKYLRISCKKCTRVRLDGIGFLAREARFGARTVTQMEESARCHGCRWDVTITLSD